MAWWNPFAKKEPPPEPPPPPLEPIPDNEAGRRLVECIEFAEKAYDDMYESRSPTGAYSDMKDFMSEAIGLARRLNLPNRTAALEKTLAHRQAVFRSQMS